MNLFFFFFSFFFPNAHVMRKGKKRMMQPKAEEYIYVNIFLCDTVTDRIKKDIRCLKITVNDFGLGTVQISQTSGSTKGNLHS